MSKQCTPLWREAHVDVKTYRTHHSRSTFRSWDVQKVCTPLWREAHFEVKMTKAFHSRCTFGSWDVEKMHATVARSMFWSQNTKKHHTFGPLLGVEMSKKCMRLWREACFEVKIPKNTTPSEEVEMSKKCRPLWREVKSAKNWPSRTTFWT